MKRKTYAHICVGYDGHECGNVTYKPAGETRGRKKKRCDDCEREYRRLYQAQYYLTHLEKAQAYQNQYNIQHRKAIRRNNNFRAQYSTTAKQQEREKTKSKYTHSDLMHSATGSFEKALSRILSGKAELAAVK